MTIDEILNSLNSTSENNRIEAKRGSKIDKSILQSVNAMCNTQGLGGGWIVLGIAEERRGNKKVFVPVGLDDVDKIQNDLATQCRTAFTMPITPNITTHKLEDKVLLLAFIPEVDSGVKPVRFLNTPLPDGAFIRVGGGDHRLTDEDMRDLFRAASPFDENIVPDSSLEDVDYDTLTIYREARRKANPLAEEVRFDDRNLLYALGAIKERNNHWYLTYTGLIVFGSRLALRRLMPMCKIDYIRVPGEVWMADAEIRYTSETELRDPAIKLVNRVVASIIDDLPRNFYLPKGSLFSKTNPILPVEVLREAVVNAIMHRSYDVSSPTQVIRYSNRIVISNAGYSLKPEDTLGQAGSFNRNEHIASIFHDANLAENKGTGIAKMIRLMDEAKMERPLFKSDRRRNTFELTLPLQSLIGEEYLVWLSCLNHFNLNDNQRQVLASLKSTNTTRIANRDYCNITGANPNEARKDLKSFVTLGLFHKKGLGKGTYYDVTPKLNDYFSKKVDPEVISAMRQEEITDVCAGIMEPIDFLKLSSDERDELVLKYIEKDESLTFREFADQFKVSINTISIVFDRLREKGLIEKVGQGKNTLWCVVDVDKH